MNAAKIVKARYDRDLASIIQTADLIGADGVPIVWTSRLLGEPLPGRVNGTDLMERLLELAAKKQYRVYFLGAKPQVIQRAVDLFLKMYPGLVVAGYRHGYFESPNDEIQVAEEIGKANADILLIGMGSPMKEKWVRRHIQRLNVPVIHGVGGSFDIYGGYTKRAPIWMQKAGLEWLYRIIQEPRRMWKRYLTTNAIYIVLTIYELIKKLYAFFIKQTDHVNDFRK